MACQRDVIDQLCRAVEDLHHRLDKLEAGLENWKADHVADCQELVRRLAEHEVPHALYHEAVAAVLAEQRDKRARWSWRTLGRRDSD